MHVVALPWRATSKFAALIDHNVGQWHIGQLRHMKSRPEAIPTAAGGNVVASRPLEVKRPLD